MQLFSFSFLISLALANCVPTSVLVKDSVAGHNLKVKNSSSNDNAKSSHQLNAKPINKNSEIDVEIPLSSSLDLGLKASSSDSSKNLKGNSGHNAEQLALFNSIKGKSTPHKRGINSQLLYGSGIGGYGGTDDFYNPTISSGRNDGGVWSDEIDPPVMYSDSDFEDYLPNKGHYRNKPYDNLQNILNSESLYHQEPLALPLQYYLGDRRKRSNKISNGYDMRLKRDTKLSPADMLALVALVEAGERDDFDYNRPSSYYSSPEDRNDMLNSWQLPLENDNNEQGYYSGMPYNLENIPRYEILRDQKYSPNHYASSKRFMVSKKKRSLGHFYNEPISTPSLSYSPPSQQYMTAKGTKNLNKYF